MKTLMLLISCLLLNGCATYSNLFVDEDKIRAEYAQAQANRTPEEIKYDTAMGSCVAQANQYTTAQAQRGALGACLNRAGY